MLEPGMVIDGTYKILNKIGQGGMSTVYLAMNERANNIVRRSRKYERRAVNMTGQSVRNC